jgi:hypothetical protein
MPKFTRSHLKAAACSLLLALGAGAVHAQASTFSEVNVARYNADYQQVQGLCFQYSANGAALACNGSSDLAGSTLTYGSSASGDFGVLKVFGAQYIARAGAPGTAANGDFLSATAYAGFSDSWTLLGQSAGTVGTLRLGFNITGSYDFSMVGTGVTYGFSLYNASFGTYASDSQLPSYQATLTTSFVYGTPLDFSITLVGGSDLYNIDGGGYNSQSSFMDMSHTAIMDAIVVLDAQGQAMPFSLSTASGAALFTQLASPVPEPGGLQLLSAGLVLLGLRRWALATSARA